MMMMTTVQVENRVVASIGAACRGRKVCG